ncbi:Lrp/AsnC family transcriptional regulator [Bradyrhizobium sp. Ai1a-2]|uniref:Lrp/AsnC family transcriptional regulator n=1 Tax=Bradyrhizobium sp. Ai1a-2 TaxID=196490 RepID=UPI000A02F642|nr:Lrp/AsnC family transcriptional regulator [Bradyrhizobium sp. Ai1a-2]
MPIDIDAVDRKILRILQRDAKTLNTELASQVGLSPSPCLRRVRLLEEAGVVERYVALLNPSSVDLAMTIFVRITLERQDQATVEHFAAEVRKLPQVVEAHLMAGGYDYLLKVVVANLDEYRRVHMGHFAAVAGVRNVQTEIPLQQIKHSTELPI